MQGLPNPYAKPYTYADMPSQVKRTPFEQPKIELPKLNKDLFRPVDNVYQNQYNTRKEIESQLGKYYSSFDEGVGKIAAEAIEDLKRVEGTIENSVLPSNGLRPEGALGSQTRQGGIQDKPYKTVGLSFSKELIDTGKVNLTDIVYKDTKDLAVISQVYRDPRFETFRIVYVKGNENKIVGVDGVSSRIPGSSKVFIDTNANKSISKIQSRMNRLGADGYYLVHNHPSGNPTPSQSDVNVTAHLANKVKGFKEHIVINSNKFSANVN